MATTLKFQYSFKIVTIAIEYVDASRGTGRLFVHEPFYQKVYPSKDPRMKYMGPNFRF